MKAMKHAHKRMYASVVPHQCVVLSVDPGERSGWAIFLRGIDIDSGEVSASSVRVIANIIFSAREIAHARNLPLVLVRERPFGGRMGMNSSGASRVWKAFWDSSGVVKSRSVTVYPSTWRSKVLGRGWGNKPRDVVRPEEQRVAKMIAGMATVGADEAAAICLGRWATHAPEVLRVLPKVRTTKTRRRV